MFDLLASRSAVDLMILQSVAFISIWASLHFYVSYRGPFPGAYAVMKANSLFYATASMVLLALILSPHHDDLARRVYHASKFYEYIDIINVRAMGSSIDLHFGFHHLTTPYFTFFRVLHHSKGWKVFAALNAFHHVLLYAYFGGVGWVRPVLLWTGTLQLVAGIIVEGWILRVKMLNIEGDTLPNWIAACILSIYLVLNTRDLILRSREKDSRQKDA